MIGKPTSESRQEHSRRHRILGAARDCMLSQGYAATSVDQICKAAGVTKGAFFHHFESKEAMARQLLDRFIEALLAPMAFARDPRGAAEPLKRLRLTVETLAGAYEKMESPGCLIGLFVVELADSNEQFRAVCARGFDKIATGIERELLAAGLPADLDAGAVAWSMVAALQGGVILGRAANDRALIRRVIEAQLTQIERLCAVAPPDGD